MMLVFVFPGCFFSLLPPLCWFLRVTADEGNEGALGWLWLCVGMERDDCRFATETGVNSWTSWNPLRVTRSHCVIVFCCCCCSLSLRPLPSLLLFCFWLDDVFSALCFLRLFRQYSAKNRKTKILLFSKNNCRRGREGCKGRELSVRAAHKQKKVGKREKLFSLQQS